MKIQFFFEFLASGIFQFPIIALKSIILEVLVDFASCRSEHFGVSGARERSQQISKGLAERSNVLLDVLDDVKAAVHQLRVRPG